MICYEISNRLKETLEFIVASFYALYCKVFFNKTRRAVIYYHSINKSDVTGFKRQMSYLAKNCHVIKPSEIIMASEGGAQAVVAITFDDAFVNILKNAIPILKEYSLPLLTGWGNYRIGRFQKLMLTRRNLLWIVSKLSS